MKFKSHLVLAFLCAASSALFAPRVHGQGTAFTYQGFITAQGAPANGLHDFQFLLYDSATGGNFLGGFDMDEVNVTSGLFNVSLDFGSAPFNGQPRWLQIAVTATGSGQPLTTLAPRHALAPTPYAILAGNVPNGAITSSKLAPGAVTSASIGAGAITSNNLAAGAAAANLAAGGSAPVAGGGIILSEQSNATNLLNAGYVKLGKLHLIDEAWQQHASSAGGSFQRTDHVAVWTGTEMLVWGGRYSQATLDTGLRYNPVTDSWSAMSSLGAPNGRTDFSVVWTGTQMVIWGGNSGYDPFYNSGSRYNPATDIWTPTTQTGAPSVRALHSAVWTGSEMIVWGGYYRNDGFGPVIRLSDGARYNPATDVWTAITSVGAPAGRAAHSAVWTGTQMIVWGGGSGFFPFGYPRGAETANADGGRYNLASNTWTSISTSGSPSARAYHTAVWTGTEMLVWGGAGPAGSYADALGDGARYNPAANSWSAINPAGAPSKRNHPAVVWAGSRMIVWGGEYNGAFESTGARYAPASNTWTSTSVFGAPTARSGHTGVWTGTQMVVWGGTDDSDVLQSVGGRYDPVADNWVPTAVKTDATERNEHTAVWTGSEMLVFGGNGGGFVMDKGLRYNPVTEQWTPMASSGAPVARKYHTAVWTGTEMLIWGGRDNATQLQTGGRFNPVLNTWPTLSRGLPTGRRHRALQERASAAPPFTEAGVGGRAVHALRLA